MDLLLMNYKTTPNQSSNAVALGNPEYPFIAIAPRSTLARSGST